MATQPSWRQPGVSTRVCKVLLSSEQTQKSMNHVLRSVALNMQLIMCCSSRWKCGARVARRRFWDKMLSDGSSPLFNDSSDGQCDCYFRTRCLWNSHACLSATSHLTKFAIVRHDFFQGPSPRSVDRSHVLSVCRSYTTISQWSLIS